VADESEDLYNQKNALAIDYNTALNKYNNAATAIKDDFDMRQKEVEFNNAQRNQQMKEL
jgi:hypothetical protein